MKTCGIYKITNKVNQNLYIGKSIWIENRWQQHIFDALNRPKTAIDFAIRKYGIDNFTNEIIEKCSSELYPAWILCVLKPNLSLISEFSSLFFISYCLYMITMV